MYFCITTVSALQRTNEVGPFNEILLLYRNDDPGSPTFDKNSYRKYATKTSPYIHTLFHLVFWKTSEQFGISIQFKSSLGT